MFEDVYIKECNLHNENGYLDIGHLRSLQIHVFVAIFFYNIFFDALLEIYFMINFILWNLQLMVLIY